MTKWVYSFSAERAEGRGEMKNLLGGKGANLPRWPLSACRFPRASPSPTEVCTVFYATASLPARSARRSTRRSRRSRAQTGRAFGDPANPLLVSVRSGARASMPGMMDTVLNLGLNDPRSKGCRKLRATPFRLRQLSPLHPDVFATSCSTSITAISRNPGASRKTRATRSTPNFRRGLARVIADYKAGVIEESGKPSRRSPTPAVGRDRRGVRFVVNQRAITYRRLNDIPGEWGTAVNVQAMVFGNMGETRRPASPSRAIPRRRKRALRRVPGQRAGRGRGRRHPHAAEHHQGGAQGRRLRPALAGNADARGLHQFVATTKLSKSTIATCRTSSSRSRAASCGCCRPATASARQGRAQCAVEMADEGLISREEAMRGSSPARSISCCTRRSTPRRTRDDRDRPARFARRSVGRDRVSADEEQTLRQPDGSDPRPDRDLARGHPRHARRQGRRDRAAA